MLLFSISIAYFFLFVSKRIFGFLSDTKRMMKAKAQTVCLLFFQAINSEVNVISNSKLKK